MGQDNRNTSSRDEQNLGQAFESQSSPSFAGDLGKEFEEHNSSRKEWIAEQHRTRHRLLWMGGLLLLLIVVASIYFITKPKTSGSTGGASAAGGSGSSGNKGSKGGGGRGQQGPAVITVGETQTGNMPVYVNALGTVTPVNTVTVYSQITGRVTGVYYHEGQIVHKGQPLIDIDPRPYEADLKQAEGTLLRDEGVLAEAEMDLERYRAAYAANAIARQQVEDQEKTVTQDEGTVRSDEGTVQYDKVQLSYCHIVSPISGKVGLRLVDPGNTVFSGTGSTLLVVTQLQPITVVFNVAEDDLPQIQQYFKGRGSLHVDALDRSDDKQLASGSLSALDNQIDTATGTLKLRAVFPNGDLALYPNQFVNARLLVKTLENVVLIPTPAVQHNGTAAFVYLVHPGAPSGEEEEKAEEKKEPSKNSEAKNGAPAKPAGPSGTVSIQGVTTQTSNEKTTAIQGVGPNVQVATSGFDRLESGAKVQITKGNPKESQGPSGSSSTAQGAASSGSTAP